MAKKAKQAKASKAPKARKGTPGHYTESGTRKFQANGPIDWAATFKAAAGEGREGEGIRAAMAYAIAHKAQFLAWSKAQAKAAAKEAK